MEKSIESIKKDILVDSGLVYADYGLITERELGVCIGANKFKAESEFHYIEANGQKGKEKGARRKDKESASITVVLRDISLENLRLAMPGSVITVNKVSGGFILTNDTYLANLTLISNTHGQVFKKFMIANAQAEGGIEMEFKDADESSIEITFNAHYDRTKPAEDLWSIEDLTTLAAGV